MAGENLAALAAAARALAADGVAAEAAGVLRAEGIEPILLKGPAIAQWLYPREARVYIDADLLVSPDDFVRAGAALERVGFRPGTATQHATPYVREQDRALVDLHRTLWAIDAFPAAVWRGLQPHTREMKLGGSVVRVPDEPALALITSLHVHHHLSDPRIAFAKPAEDLRRAIAKGDAATWRAAAQIARQIDGVFPFTSGLRHLPEGQALADELGLPSAQEVGVILANPWTEPIAGGLVRMRSEKGGAAKLRLLVHELWPPEDELRDFSPLARRGRRGVMAARLHRVGWLLCRLPAGVVGYVRMRREMRA